MALSWKFTADTGPFRRGLAQMRTETKAWSGSMLRMLTGVFTATAVTAGFKNWITQMDRLGKMAKKLGADVEDLQRVKLVADKNGIAIEQVANLMVRLERRFGEAARGSENMAEALRNAGLEASRFQGLPIDQKILALSTAFQESQGSGTELADLFKVLDTEARELIPLLKQGPAALADEMERASVVTGSTVERIEQLNDRLTDIKTKISVAFATVFNFIDKTGQTIGAWIGATIKSFSHLFQFIGEGFARMWEGVRDGLQEGDFDPVRRALTDLNSQAENTGKAITAALTEAAEESVRVWDKSSKKIASDLSKLKPLLPESDMFQGRTPFSGRNDPANPVNASGLGAAAVPGSSNTPPLLDLLAENPVPFGDEAASTALGRPLPSVPVSSIRAIGGATGAGGGTAPGAELVSLGRLQLSELQGIRGAITTTDEGLPKVAEPRG